MRVLFITQTPEFGGTERHTAELLRRLQGDVESTVVSLAEDFYAEQLRGVQGVRVVKHARIWTWKVFRFWFLILRYWAPVVVFPKGTPDQFPLAAYIAARCAGVRRIVCIEHLIWDPAPSEQGGGGIRAALRRLIGWRRRFLFEKWVQGRIVDLTICVSEAIRSRLVEEFAYPPSRTVVVRNGADLAHYALVEQAHRTGASHGASSGPLQIVCVARLSPVKRVDVLIEALALLVVRGVSTECTIVGGGPLLPSLKSLAMERGLGSRVTFTGHVSDTKRYVDRADVCVLSSDKEGLPLALVEAMAAGVPCVATDVGGTREIVLHGKTGLLIKPDSPHELADAIALLSDQPETRRVMARSAADWARQEFDLERQMHKLKTVLLPVAV